MQSLLQMGNAESPLVSRVDRWCLLLLAHQLAGARCEIRLWDGTTVSCSDLPSAGVVTIRNRAALWRLLRAPEPALGESCADGAIDVTGDLTAMRESVDLGLEFFRLWRSLATNVVGIRDAQR